MFQQTKANPLECFIKKLVVEVRGRISGADLSLTFIGKTFLKILSLSPNNKP